MEGEIGGTHEGGGGGGGEEQEKEDCVGEMQHARRSGQRWAMRVASFLQQRAVRAATLIVGLVNIMTMKSQLLSHMCLFDISN